MRDRVFVPPKRLVPTAAAAIVVVAVDVVVVTVVVQSYSGRVYSPTVVELYLINYKQGLRTRMLLLSSKQLFSNACVLLHVLLP